MIRVPLKKCIAAVAALAGINAGTQLSGDQRGLLIVFLGEALRDCVEAIPWWQYERIEERFFAPVWVDGVTSGAGYEDGDVVRVEDDDVWTYWEAQQQISMVDNTSSPPDAIDGLWAETTEYARVIDLAQSGETVMGAVLEVWDADPRECAGAQQVSFLLRNEEIVLKPCLVGTSCWVVFQAATPALDATIWTTGEVIAEGDVRYDVTAGDCYRALVAISTDDNTVRPGENAVAEEDVVWALVEIPEHLQSAINLGASAHYLRADGQEEKATRREAAAQTALERAIVRNTLHQQQTKRYAARRH
jgi:hypothetical protein